MGFGECCLCGSLVKVFEYFMEKGGGRRITDRSVLSVSILE